MKISYSDFEKVIRDKLVRENGQSQFSIENRAREIRAAIANLKE